MLWVGWNWDGMVIIGHRSFKSTIGATNKNDYLILCWEFAKNDSNNFLHRHFKVNKNVSLSVEALSQCALVAVGMWAQVTSLVITP